MTTQEPAHDVQPEWSDVVMKALPVMYRLGELNGIDDCVFVYATVFFSVKEELRRGAPDHAIRQQARSILRYIDTSDRPENDKEQFAAPFARAVEDALEGRPPCVLGPPDSCFLA
jgi:hypothetical protein